LAALIVATVPAWMVLMHAAITKTRIPRPLIAALVIGTAGVAVLVGGPGSAIDMGAAGIVLIASVFWAAGSVSARMLPLPKHPLVATSLQMLSGGVLLLLLAAARGEFGAFHLADVSTRSAVAMVWLTILGSMVAFSAYVYAIRTLPNDVVATYAYVNPIVAVALGAIIDKEPVTRNLLLGGAIIIGSVVLIVNDSVKRVS
jgi:drug/metabolite transporter (DMT)-like permease